MIGSVETSGAGAPAQACPLCGRSSGTTKVSTIVADRTAAPELAGLLGRPPAPARSLGVTVPAMVLYALGLSVAVSGAAGLGHRLFGLMRIIGSGYAPDDLLSGLAAI